MNRNTVLNDVKDALVNITIINNFNNNIQQVLRKFIWYDTVYSWPTLLVIGGEELLEDEISKAAINTLSVRIIGYSKDSEKPEEAQCKLIEDVINCLNNSVYNKQFLRMRILKIETDEGMLTPLAEGVGMFVLNLEFIYRESR